LAQAAPAAKKAAAAPAPKAAAKKAAAADAGPVSVGFSGVPADFARPVVNCPSGYPAEETTQTVRCPLPPLSLLLFHASVRVLPCVLEKETAQFMEIIFQCCVSAARIRLYGV
jgi:hypothetical protein